MSCHPQQKAHGHGISAAVGSVRSASMIFRQTVVAAIVARRVGTRRNPENYRAARGGKPHDLRNSSRYRGIPRLRLIVAKATPYAAVYKLDILSATGTAIFIAAIISMVVLGMRTSDAAKALKETVVELKRPIKKKAAVP